MFSAHHFAMSCLLLIILRPLQLGVAILMVLWVNLVFGRILASGVYGTVFLSAGLTCTFDPCVFEFGFCVAFELPVCGAGGFDPNGSRFIGPF